MSSPVISSVSDFTQHSFPLKILVPIKRVPDTDVKIRLKNGLPDWEGVKFVINPFDAIALEEALKISEKAGPVETVLVGVGGSECVEQLRTGLAMGADRAVLVKTDSSLDPLAIAKILVAACKREKPDLVLMGKQATDDDSSQVGPMMGALLGWGQATFVSKVELLNGPQRVRCHRETDAGMEVVSVSLPALLTTDLRLNEPRYVSLPGLMKAKKKPLEEISPADLGENPVSRTKIMGMEPPPSRKAGVRLASVTELVERLKNEAKIIAS